MDEYSIEQLIGKTLVEITGCKNGSDMVRFVADDGSRFEMFHEQDCCENVQIEDVCGEPEWLVGSPLLQAEERSNSDNPPAGSESHTWTFYDISTNRGTVTLRWLGESNGYYSESVTFRKVA